MSDLIERLERAAAQFLGSPLIYGLLTEAAIALKTQHSESAATEHDWRPDGDILKFESHPGGESPHVHTTCSKCGARAWFLEYQWELLAKGCTNTPSKGAGDDADL